MNKENRCAASLRRSAVVERIRLREEWSALKGTTNNTEKTLKQNNKKSRRNQIINTALSPQKNTLAYKKVDTSDKQVSDVLRGIVVLVEVGSAARALALRAALAALGASVVPNWSPLVTHLVWTQGGCRSIRAKARALACQLVSPLWVEACAAEARKLPERIFPAPSRPSDLPSPTTLRRLLKKAEHENIPLQQLLPNSQSSDVRPARLRLSSETEKDTTISTDTSRDVSKNTSHDSPTRVKTAPRRPPQNPIKPQKPTKSKRKLFTQREPELLTTDEENDTEPLTAEPKKVQKLKITLRKDLAQAERLAKRLMGATPAKDMHACTQKKTIFGTQFNKPPRIVLTGMSRTERQNAWRAIRELNGKVQNHVDRKTTHVIMGSCHDLEPTIPAVSRESPKINPDKSPNEENQNLSICSQCNSPGKILTLMFANNVTVGTNVQNRITDKVICKCKNNDISGVNYLSDTQSNKDTRVNPGRQSNKDTRINIRTQSNEVLRSIDENAQSDVSDKILCSARRKTRSSYALSLTKKNVLNNEGIGINTRSNSDLGCPVENVHVSSPSKRNTQSSDIFASENTQNNLGTGRDTQCNLISPTRGNTENNLITFKENRGNNDVLNSSIDNIQSNDICPVSDNNIGTLESVVKKIKPRTVNALLGAARGCRVLRFEWVKDSLEANRWLQHIGYEVPHLKKMSQKARAERSALNKMHSDYAYNVFNGMRVRISPDAEQKDAIAQLLTLCGAVIQNDDPVGVRNVQNAQKKPQNGVKITFNNLLTRGEKKQNGGNNSKLISDRREKHGRRFDARTQDGAQIQDGGTFTADVDLTIGRGNGEVNSKWVFDSVAAARMRTTRRYINA